MSAGMCAFEWQLLVVVQPIREERMICRHRYLHRFNDALKLLNTLEQLLHIRDVPIVGLGLPVQKLIA